jgi:hypothetical protein
MGSQFGLQPIDGARRLHAGCGVAQQGVFNRSTAKLIDVDAPHEHGVATKT